MPPERAEGRTAGRGRRAGDRPGRLVLPDHQVRRGPWGLRDHRGRQDPAVRQALQGRPGPRDREEHRDLPGLRPGRPDHPVCRALAAAPADDQEVAAPEGRADVEEW
ncbi:hypothetical protein H074_15947 [Amycolatopsis decaplanina DSM 44594]|uniref:Uncharacterized protein n=1 Tax=Amycolatopsis decaplanina DSM 44594 TaxID=1284240 RepID=M2YZX5_9PSEU|nr:hypothetical protein H074_15947 [Amycolatopsis decaplanina DSM 44594]